MAKMRGGGIQEGGESLRSSFFIDDQSRATRNDSGQGENEKVTNNSHRKYCN